MSDLSPNSSLPLNNKMEGANTETAVDICYTSEASTGGKRKREGKVRSIVWDHFTKIIKEDGTSDKCQCNHCQKLFTCSSRSGTTHLLRHITDGICAAFKRETANLALPAPSHMRGRVEQRNGYLPWKYDQGLDESSMDVEVEMTPDGIADHDRVSYRDEYGIPSPNPRGKLPQQSALKCQPMQQSGSKCQPKGEAWMNEFRSCVAKLVQLTSGRVPVGSLQSSSGPDYSLASAVRCLNEMEDIPESSEMYLDAFEILQDASERESFVCLPSEPRRRWLQRTLHRRYPLRYRSSCEL